MSGEEKIKFRRGANVNTKYILIGDSAVEFFFQNSRNFLKRLLMSKAGLVVIAFRKIQTLPERKDNATYLKATKFEKGLSLFVEKTLRGSFAPFRNEFE